MTPENPDSCEEGNHWGYPKTDKEKLLSLGTYPDTSLKDARERRDEARKQVAAGIDPGEHRKARKTATIAKQSNGRGADDSR